MALISGLVIFHCVVGCTLSWVFTDIKYPVDNMLKYPQNTEDMEKTFYLNADDKELEFRNLSLIYPGTRWCGPGNIANGDDDLGELMATDRCCRAHDHCSDIISAGETRHNLTNPSYYTRLSCDCDMKFRGCLQTDGSKHSNNIGVIYFNIIGTQCFRYDYPIKRCIRQSGWLKKKCVEYEYDVNGEKRYQWFDVPNYGIL